MTDVRSVTVHLHASVDGYIRDMRRAGKETDRAFSSSHANLAATNRELGVAQLRMSKLDAAGRSMNTTIARSNTRLRVMAEQSTALSTGLAGIRNEAGALSGGGSGSIVTLGRNSDRTGRQIDRLSGRLALFAQAAAVLGPAIIPLSAAVTPVLAGIATGLTVTAGAAVTALLAFNGVGDGLKALNAYQLEPTAENLAKMQIELQKLGPDGAHFVRFLDDLEPQLRELQLTARAGLLPGAEEGITHLLDLLPQAKRLVGETASAMGELAADAGEGLAGPRFEGFFDYLDDEARPILIQMGHTVGNLVDGLAAMMVAFGPLTSDFTSGFEDMSASFADWAHGLDDSESFESFLDYVQKAGPQALDFLGSFIGLLVQVTQAAAPVGDAVLPALTALLDVVAELADSPLGTTFFTAAAAFSVYSRAADLATRVTDKYGKSVTGLPLTRIAAGLGMAALALTDVDDKAGLSNTAMLALAGSMAGPWGAAAGAAVGLTMDLAAANDDLEAAIRRAEDAARSGSMSERRQELRQLREEMREAASDAQALEDFLTFQPTDQGYLENMGNVLSGLSNKLFGTGDAADFAKGELTDSLRQGGGAADLFAETIGRTGNQMRIASSSAKDLATSLGALEGFFDRRAALRAYEQSIDDLTAALKETPNAWDPGKKAGRENLELLDANATAAINYAKQIKNTGQRQTFLDGFREQLVAVRKTSPQAAAAVDRVLRKLDRVGLTRPKVDIDDRPARGKLRGLNKDADEFDRKRPRAKADVDNKSARRKLDQGEDWILAWGRRNAAAKVDADTKRARAGFNGVNQQLDNLVARHTTVAVRAETGQALAALNGIQDYQLRDKYITVHTRNTGGPYSSANGNIFESVRAYANGDIANGHQPELAGPGPTRIWREPETAGEAYVPLANDSRRPRAKSILEQTASMFGGVVEWYAEGGISGRPRPTGAPGNPGMDRATRAVDRFAGSLGRAKKALDDETNKRQALISKRKDLSGSIQDGLRTDLFAEPDNPWAKGAQGGVNGTLKGDIGRARRLARLIKELKGKGLDGPALTEIIATGDVERAEVYADMSRRSLNRFENLYELRERTLRRTGLAGGNAAFGQDIRETTREIRNLRADVKRLEHAVKHDGPKATGDAVGHAVNKGASDGARRGRG